MKKILLITLVIMSTVSSAAAEVYLWPMHGQRRLSSSFSEYREGHYHAGIDLRSFGSVGLPCLAVSDGYVSRVRISPGGYGKALYLKLSDGNTAVYAHLDCFGGAIDSLLYHKRLDSGKSWCDLTLPAGKYRFATGDTVAFSGHSGTTAPHLHFELRDERERPLNPLEMFYSIPDRSSPMMSGIEVIPLEKGSLVNGSPVTSIFLLRASGRNRFIMPDTLQLQGSFSFGVSAWDEQGYGRYPMAPLVIEVRIDGKPLYTLRNSIFSYTQSGEIRQEFDIFGKGPSGRYSLLYRKKGNSRQDRTGDGKIHSDPGAEGGLYLEKGIHSGEIVAVDASGNRSVASFTIKINTYPYIAEAKRLEAAPEAVLRGVDPDGGEVKEQFFGSLDGGKNWIELPLERFGKYSRGEVFGDREAAYMYEVIDDEGAVASAYLMPVAEYGESDNSFCEVSLRNHPAGIIAEIHYDRIIAGMPSLARLTDSQPEIFDLYRTGPMDFISIVPRQRLSNGLNIFMSQGRDYRGYRAESVKAFNIHTFSSGGKAAIPICDTLDAWLEAPSVWEPVTCIVREVSLQGAVGPGLRRVCQPFSIDFSGDLLRRPLKIRVDSSRRTGLFEWKEDKGWECAGVPAMEDGTVNITSPGVFILLEDGIPPVIKHVAIEDGHSGSSFFKTYYCSLPVIEEGSGIDPWSAEASIDGERVVCEYDMPRDRLVLPIPHYFRKGSVKLTVEISDRAGNRTVEEFGFMLE